jgi:ketosteroid isomerase-like protein
MSAGENKLLMQYVFGEAEKGNIQPFLDALSDDIEWTVIGSTKFSKTYRGKQTVIDELIGPLVAQLSGHPTLTAQRFIADGDHVVVESRGNMTTQTGVPYNNTYCNVYQLSGGKVQRLTEYLDTELVTAAFGR